MNLRSAVALESNRPSQAMTWMNETERTAIAKTWPDHDQSQGQKQDI